MSSLSSFGEFGLIENLTQSFHCPHPLHTGIGDDCAVFEQKNGTHSLLTVDTLVEGDHFRTDWSTARQIGNKAMEVNVSDIVAMGGVPTYALLAIVLTKNTTAQWVQELYSGVHSVCKKYNITLAGGDTTHGDVCMISVTLMGTVTPQNLCLRSNAQPGDRICVTGSLGGSTAGLWALQKKIPLTPFLEKKHKEPKAQFFLSQVIAPLAHAMIDVSDGIASEVKHICMQSNVGAIIRYADMPIHRDVFAMEECMKKKKYSAALSGGEDFELLFTISKEKLYILQSQQKNITVIGEITEEKRYIGVNDDGVEEELPKGFEHF